MYLIQGTSKDGFEAKIKFVILFFSKINIARSIISLVNRYGESGKKLCHFTTCWGDSVFFFVAFFKNLKSKGNFFMQKAMQNYLKILTKSSFSAEKHQF